MNSFYIHGSQDEEQVRLSLLNDLLNDAYLREIGPIHASRIVDFGAGLGHFTRLLRAAAPSNAFVMGLERDTRQLHKAMELTPAADVSFVQADVTALEMEDALWGSFDLAHARFVLEHVPDPMAVVNAMARSVRSGGSVVLSDDDHSTMTIFPHVDGFAQVWNAYAQSYIINGNDPFVGRKLVSLMTRADLVPVRNGFVFFGSHAGEPHFQDYVTNLIGVVRGASEVMTSSGLAETEQIETVLDRFQQWSHRKDAAIWYPLFYAIGRKA